MKYAFDHEQEKLPQALGMTDERATEIIRHCRMEEIDAENTLEHFENTINAVDPKNMVEAMFMGYSLGRITEARHGTDRGIQSALSRLWGNLKPETQPTQ